jgi:hypothetical protein
LVSYNYSYYYYLELFELDLYISLVEEYFEVNLYQYTGDKVAAVEHNYCCFEE